MRAVLADIVLVVHFAIAIFVVAGLGLTWLGGACGWRWIRSFPFRLAHFAAISFVAIEGLLGITCPLTLWEDSLRQTSGDASFVARWVRRLLFYDLPELAFTSAYVAVAAATAVTWWRLPPARRSAPDSD